VPASTCAACAVRMVAWWTGEGTASDHLGVNNGVLEGGLTFVRGSLARLRLQRHRRRSARARLVQPRRWGCGRVSIEMWINPADVAQGQVLAEWYSWGQQTAFYLASPWVETGSVHVNLGD